ncbi:hypothetical protein R6Q59_004588 [Mikania micrantha]
MNISLSTVWVGMVTVAVAATVVYGWRFFNWAWLRPKRTEKSLREQGLTGNRYRFLFGDLKEVAKTAEQAKLKPIKLTDNIVPRVMPYFYTAANTYGNLFIHGSRHMLLPPRPPSLILRRTVTDSTAATSTPPISFASTPPIPFVFSCTHHRVQLHPSTNRLRIEKLITVVYDQAASNLVAGSNLEGTIQHILDMGGGPAMGRK